MGTFIAGLDIEKYHKHPAIGRSGLAELSRTPKHYWWKYLSGQAEHEETDALRIGQAFHTLVLEPRLFEDKFIIWSGAPRNTKEGKADFAKALESGKTPIKSVEFDQLRSMARALKAEPASKKILVADGQIEPSYFWQEDGVEFKTRPDYFRNDGIVLDVKTCNDASEDAFQKSIVNYYYDIQVYMTLRGIEVVTGIRPSAFVFVCVEKDAPHCTAFYNATDELIAIGEARFKRLLGIYKACKASGLWPGYGHQVRPIGVPDWFAKRVLVEG